MKILSSLTEKNILLHIKYCHKQHEILSKNIANASTPNYKAYMLKDFNHIVNNSSINYNNFDVKKIQGEEKENGNDVNEKEQHKYIVENEQMIDFLQSQLQNINDMSYSALGIKKN